jgi:GNAT superfamily N-acetyltransferase
LVPREPTQEEFYPVGHVALDVHTAEEDIELGLPAEGVVWIHPLYVSDALQRGGFGAASMQKAEAVAAQEPLNGKILALDTMTEDCHSSPTGRKFLFEDRGLPVPPVSRAARWGPDTRLITVEIDHRSRRKHGIKAEDTRDSF